MTLGALSSRANPPNGVTGRRWWVLVTVLAALLVAVPLVAARRPTPVEPAGALWTSVVAPVDVTKIVTPGTSGGTVSGGALAAPPVDVTKIVTPGISGATGPVVAAGPRISSEVVSGSVPDALALTRSEPTRVRIPAIQLDSELIALGLQPDGRMEVPPQAFPGGWYTGAPTPGELGPAILAGHVDYGGSVGVFYRLGDLEPGDTVEVDRQDGSTAVFRITKVQQHRKDAFPTAAVYGDIDHAGLRLITCGGQFDRKAHSYEDNIVVFAELVIGNDQN